MRFLSLLLLASLVLNGGLVAAHLLGRPGAPRVGIVVGTPRTERAASSTATEPSPGPESPIWTKLSGENDAHFVARLRAAGFPREVIRTIVGELLNERFEERRKAAGPGLPKYWQRFDTVLRATPEQYAERRRIDREYRAAMEALLGEDAYPKNDAATRRRYGELPPSKIAEIKAIEDDYADMMRAIREEARGVNLPEDEAKYALLEEEKRNDLAAALTRDELLAYELRNSSTATGLRSQLLAFEPSEDEFVTLFHVQRDVERALAALGRKPTADEAREIRETRVQAVLSAARFDDYQIKTAGGYRDVQRFVELRELPATAAGDILRTQRDTRREVRAIETDASLTAEQRQARLAAIGSQARARLEAAIGSQALSEYLNHQGQWLVKLPQSSSGQP